MALWLRTAAVLVCGGVVAWWGHDGVLDAHYTDHFRHMAEASAWPDYGYALYRTPFVEVQQHMGLGAEHTGQWVDEPTVVPPLVVALHAPSAWLERAGWLAPASAHQSMGVLLALLGGLAAVLLERVLRPTRRDWPRAVAFFAIALPLTLGAAFNGFPDVAFFAAAAGALLCMQRGEWQAALVLWALCGALHFRAAAFLPAALVCLAQVVRGFSQQRLRTAMTVLVAAAIVAPALVAAASVLGHTHFENVNPISYTRFKPRVVVFAVLTLALLAWAWSARLTLLAGVTSSAAVMASLDPHHAYWHSFVLLAPMLVAATLVEERPRAFHVALAYAVAATALGYVYRFTPWWQWLVDLVVGH